MFAPFQTNNGGRDNQTPGRVNLDSTNATEVGRLPGFQYQTNISRSTAVEDGIRGNWQENLLNRTFFSPENFQIIQNKIRFHVYQETGQVIDPQSSDDLFMLCVRYTYRMVVTCPTISQNKWRNSINMSPIGRCPKSAQS